MQLLENAATARTRIVLSTLPGRQANKNLDLTWKAAIFLWIKKTVSQDESRVYGKCYISS